MGGEVMAAQPVSCGSYRRTARGCIENAPRVSDFVRTGIDVVWTRGECRPPRRARRETNASPRAVSPVSGVRTLYGRRSDPVSDVCSLLRLSSKLRDVSGMPHR